MAVVALYGMRPGESVTIRSMVGELRAMERWSDWLRILLFDNSPSPLNQASVPPGFEYRAAGRNEGVAGAYNAALRIARAESFDWLLTLDQDTDLPPGFLARMRELTIEKQPHKRVASIVPQLVQGDALLSPYRMLPWGIRHLPRGIQGMAAGEIHALNSGSLFRVEALRRVGGFDPRFWLDFQDYSIFRQLHRSGGRVWIAGEITVEHNLSLIRENNSPTPARFRNFLLAESAFCDLYGEFLSGPVLTGRLAIRWWRQQREGAGTRIRSLVLETLKRRIFWSRSRRLRVWEAELNQRIHGCDGQGNIDRPAVSVCMATYNGEIYVKQQLQSILSQLSEGDEVIVVDDASTDSTREEVRAVNDARIQLIEHSLSRGIVQTFEEGICAASNEIIFLSDQDDLWLPKKVSTILSLFARDPEVKLITSAVKLIDSSGELLDELDIPQARSFRPGFWATLIRNQYRGCTMAFRSTLRSEILPMPKNRDVLHDIWIGVRNRLSGGKSVHIAEPLMLYRRHPTTVTGRIRLGLFRKVKNRFNLVMALAGFSLHRFRKRVGLAGDGK